MADSVVEIVSQPPPVLEIVGASQATAIETGMVPIIIAPSEPDTVEVTLMTGLPGPADMLSIGTILTATAGSAASATITGEFPNRKLNLTIPRGSDGTGVPTGGTAGQVLQKNSGTNYDTSWVGVGTGTGANEIVKRDNNGWIAANGVYIENQPAQSYAATRKDYVDAQRDTRVAKSGDTMTGTLNLKDLNSIGVPASALTNAAVVPNAQNPIQDPFPALWHDIAAFSRHLGAPTFETSADGLTNWTDAGGYDKRLFARKENQNILVADGVNVDGVRWTWNSANLQYAGVRWLILGFTYVVDNTPKEIKLESFENGVWATRHLSTGNYSGTAVWCHVNDWGGAAQVRLTIRATGPGAIKMSTIRMLSNRWGDQGGGSELEIPFSWDDNRAITFVRAFADSAPTQAGELTRKDYVDGIGGANNVGNTVARRDSNGWSAFQGVTLDGAQDPSPSAATRKDYVDAADRWTPNFQSANYTLVLADANKSIMSNSASPVTITVPTNATVPFPNGTQVRVTRWQTGTASIVGASGVTLTGLGTNTLRQYDSVILIKVATDTWHVANAPALSSTSQAGLVELATTAETTTGTDTTLAVTPAGVKAVADTKAALSHTHLAADISDSTTVGRSVLTAADAAAARAAIGAGTSNLAIGTTNTTAKAGDYTPPDATTGAKGLVQLANHLGGTAAAPTVRSATEAQTGIVELATAAETTTGTDTTRAVHPAGLKVELDKKSGRVLTKRSISANYTLVAADATDMVVHSTAASAITVTLPQDSAATISQEVPIPWRQYGAGQITFVAGTGATLISRGSVFKSAGQYAEGLLTKVAANTWLLSGDITA